MRAVPAPPRPPGSDEPMRLALVLGLALALLATPLARAGDGECARLSMADVARRAGQAIRAEGYDPSAMRVEVDEGKRRWSGRQPSRYKRGAARVEDPRYVAVYFDPLPTTPPANCASIGVSVATGAMATTRTPWGAASIARLPASVTTAPLEAA